MLSIPSDSDFSLDTLPERWGHEQAAMRMAWEQLVASAGPERAPFWQEQWQSCLSAQRAELIRAYRQSWLEQQTELVRLGLQESGLGQKVGILATLDALQSLQQTWLALRSRFDRLYQDLPPPDRALPLGVLKKFWQNQARLYDSLKMNNETAFQMAHQAELRWREELFQTEGCEWVEMLALIQYSQTLCACLAYYFSLRTLLTQRLRRLESGQSLNPADLNLLRKAHRELTSAPENAGPDTPTHAWKLAIKPKSESYEVQNQWGLSLSQLNRSYLDYLKTGFYWLEQSAEQGFAQPEQLLQAAESFYKALSVNAYSYQSYWALACICFLSGLPEQALAFLEQAVHETRDPALRGLQEVLDLHSH